jgi:hypothetical protein
VVSSGCVWSTQTLPRDRSHTSFLLKQRNLITLSWFHKKIPSLRKCELHKAFAFFSCRFHVVHISRTRTGELNSHHQQSPMRVEGTHMTGCCPEGIVCDTAVTTTLTCSLRQMPHTLSSVYRRPLCRPWTFEVDIWRCCRRFDLPTFW